MKTNHYRIFTDLLPKGFLNNAISMSQLKLFFPKISKITHALVNQKRQFYAKIKKPFKLYFLLTLLISFVFLLLLFVRMQNLFFQVRQIKIEAQNKASYWNNVIKEHPDYPDAYYQAAWYSYSLGEKQKAYDLLEKAILLDPGFKKAKELREKMVKE